MVVVVVVVGLSQGVVINGWAATYGGWKVKPRQRELVLQLVLKNELVLSIIFFVAASTI